MSSMINLYDLRIYGSDKVSKMSSYCSFIFLILIIGSLATLILTLRKLKNNQNDKSLEEFNAKYSVLISDLRFNESTKIILFWKPITMVRWLITLIVLLTLNN